MSLVKKNEMVVFDVSKIKRGDLIYGRHHTWNAGKSGIVTSVKEDILIVQYQPNIGNVVNHFFIHVLEVAKSEWEIRWSSDLVDIHSYPSESDIKEVDKSDTRGTDL